jgi:hypothetical protein
MPLCEAAGRGKAPFRIKAVSGETTGTGRETPVSFIFSFQEEAVLAEEFVLELPGGWNWDKKQSMAGSYKKGDELRLDLVVRRNGQPLPFYPQSVRLSQPWAQGAAEAEAKIYYTPYGTTEVWDKADFFNLDRVWINPASKKEKQRLTLAKSDIPEGHTGATRLQFVEGLAYAVPMMPVAGEGNAQSILGKRFRGTVQGRLVSNITNDVRSSVNIPLSGVLVELREGIEVFASQYTMPTDDFLWLMTKPKAFWREICLN